MVQISNIKVGLEENRDIKIKEIISKLTKKELNYKIIKESIDARKGIQFIYTILLDIQQKDILKNTKVNYSFVDIEIPKKVILGEESLNNRPVIIGFGPAGIFCALELAKNGYKPIVFEQGNDVDNRSKDVELFWNEGILNKKSNVQFGEGGAGTFSDGKLTNRSKDPYSKQVLETLHQFGGSEEITYMSKPHIGTDILTGIIKKIREEIINLGGSIYFNSKLEDIIFNNDKIEKVIVEGKEYYTDILVLAIGHSSRDTFKLLVDKKFNIIKKPFAVGFRIEHPQLIIDKAQFKENYNHPKLKSAEYHLTHMSSLNRGCYTFCMCPGGRVIASSSEENQVVVNGMSYNARDLENANSAILCTVNPDDFNDDVLAGMNFQSKVEKKAFEMGGCNYFAPIQKVSDFIKKQESTTLGSVMPSYIPGYKFARLDTIYPNFIIDSISEAIIEMGKKLKGFDMEDAILTGVETRTSSPIRIVRNENLESTNYQNIYPCGEGAGYAGGIVSAAIDGIKVANSIIKKFNPEFLKNIY